MVSLLRLAFFGAFSTLSKSPDMLPSSSGQGTLDLAVSNLISLLSYTTTYYYYLLLLAASDLPNFEKKVFFVNDE